RADLLARLARVNADAHNPAQLLQNLQHSCEDIRRRPGYCFDPDDREALEQVLEAEKSIAELSPQLQAQLQDAAAEQKAFRADVAALYRPLGLSAISAEDDHGVPTLDVMKGATGQREWREFWTLTKQGDTLRFTVVAVRASGPGRDDPLTWLVDRKT